MHVYDDSPNSIDCTVSYERQHGIAGEDIVVAVVSFTLGTVASGIFQEIGKDLWGKIKTVYQNILKKEETKSHKVVFRVLFEYKGYPIQILFAQITAGTTRGSLSHIKSADQLLDEAQRNVLLLLQKIDSGSEYLKGRTSIHVSFDYATERWILK